MKALEKKGLEKGGKAENGSTRSPESLTYLSGFGNQHSTESEKGALPNGQNSPQKCPYGLYAEQLSGTAFTAPRQDNLRSWLYRIRPSVLQSAYRPYTTPSSQRTLLQHRPFDEQFTTPEQLRWDPVPLPQEPTDFVDGLITFAGNGGAGSVRGCAVHIYAANKSMSDRIFYDADGDLLIVPENGRLQVDTEFGALLTAPGEIILIPRGVKFRVALPDGTARGYVCENYGPAFKLPQLGPIGANGLANPRDFLAPAARYERKETQHELITKFNGSLWQSELRHSPLDVVAWHGNYYPYKYDLSLFQVVNTVSFDHPDPSIFTVLTSQSELPGIANVDFVIFPPRWMVAEHTFRPPYYHRNCMSEYMGLIFGVYDAKQEGFVPGGGSLHNCMSAHGPDATTFKKASEAKLQPQHMEGTLAFMFESSLIFNVTEFAATSSLLQKDYLSCWSGLPANFDVKNKPE